VTDGVSRARDSLLGTHTKNWHVASVLSVCTRRLDHSLLWTAREAAKAAKLVVYIMDITLASVATIVSKPKYIYLIQLECRSHILEINGPIRFKPPTFLRLVQKTLLSVQSIFPSPSCLAYPKNVAGPRA